MHREDARQCVGAGCGMAAIASTVNERGHLKLARRLAFRAPAGDMGRFRGGGGAT